VPHSWLLSLRPLAEQVRGLHEGQFDAGLARANNIGNGIVAETIWHDPLSLAVPKRHPLLAHGRVPMNEVVRYRIVDVLPNVAIFPGYEQISLAVSRLRKHKNLNINNCLRRSSGFGRSSWIAK